MSTLQERITKLLAGPPKISQAALARACGIKPPSVNDWVSGKTKSIEGENLLRAAAFLKVSPLWLATGRGAMNASADAEQLAMLKARDYATLNNDEKRTLLELDIDPLVHGDAGSAQPAARVEPNAEMLGMLSGWDSNTPLRDDEVAIPLYKEVEMAAGGGATEVVEVPGRLLRFAKSTLREAGVHEHNAACATVYGRSMERLIMDGATIGIDRGTTQILDGEIYAFDHDGMLRVKYLYRLPGGGLRIRSENDEEYPEETLSAEQAAHIRILGWVFWWSTVRRRRGLSLAR
ncbi:LexA family transcriptional regulator [Aquipseudomonas alcaligenes]|uniref:LexA family transcriptional regulator n=1 Tax=Aquipseudomonas alcaligenes TaxID=43263 RepID=UPI003648F2BD